MNHGARARWSFLAAAVCFLFPLPGLIHRPDAWRGALIFWGLGVAFVKNGLVHRRHSTADQPPA
jgi:hypothetical protein